MTDLRPDPEHLGTTTGKKHPETSHQAAMRAHLRSGTQRKTVLNLLKNAHPDGYIDEQMVQILGMNPNSQRPRRVELVEDGWIIDSGLRRLTSYNEEAIVWQYVPWGEWLKENRERFLESRKHRADLPD